MSSEREAVLQRAAAWHDAGLGVALATVVETWGSSPRPVGSQLVVDAQGRFEGSVSGGCVEATVIVAALEILNGARARELAFGVSDEDAWRVGLPCGGRITVYVEPVQDGRAASEPQLARAQLDLLVAAERQQHTVALLLDLATGTRSVLGGPSPAQLDPALLELAHAARARGQSALVAHGGKRAFVHVLSPRPRLVIVGAVHIAQSLARMAAWLDFEVVVVDPRSGFASAERFPHVVLDVRFPDEALPALGLDARTAVVTLTHESRLDDPALLAALRSPAFYVGALGSKRTQAQRRERLRAAGLDEGQLARLHGPVGLPIGALTPAEIATSILAEIVQQRRKPPASRHAAPVSQV
jgi:xanthine dehydrogenase accessory factor